MSKRSVLRRAALGGVALLLVGTASGCIAVSPNVRKSVVTSKAVGSVPPSGQWEAEQEWQCSPAGMFDPQHERATFNIAVAERMNEGWELTDTEVVSVPDSSGEIRQVCLLATFRRWSPAER